MTGINKSLHINNVKALDHFLSFLWLASNLRSFCNVFQKNRVFYDTPKTQENIVEIETIHNLIGKLLQNCHGMGVPRETALDFYWVFWLA
jgi:hypothetical protein